MSISVEVTDSTNGHSAAGVWVTLWREVAAQWHKQASICTDDAGRVDELDTASGRGRYRLMLDLDHYFAGLGATPFHSRVEVVFRVFRPGERVRVLLMVTSASCSVYTVLSGDSVDTGQAG
jgi:5-hydroxyisourate hydrolase-like protein (transthyretin family)